ncbi:Polyketide synthase modules and related proteins [hydrothermal vent metagenome]|uniref:Polyketide synthase modules and related proteins n=1 Tax=hydrothermal vent metagenome TaxID=652676 RepID=A0A3B1CDB0_9ZZZZ
MSELLHESINPNAAIRFDGRVIDATGIAHGADRVAGALAGMGVIPGDRVAILMEKSQGAIIAILGALKAGAAYVPIDPSQPEARIGLILAECGPKAIVADSALKGLEGVTRGSNLLRLGDNIDIDTARGSFSGPGGARSLAYILFTSGSTGTPKGVAMSHQGAMAFVKWAALEFAMSERDVVAMSSEFTFDLSIFDIFVSLKAGCAMAPVPKSARALPTELARWLGDEKVTTIYTVPWALMRLVQYGQLEKAPLSLKKILFAGEVYPTGKVKELFGAFPRARIYNLYGPTETNVCLFHKVSKDDLHGPIPIGLPCCGDKVKIIGGGDEGELAVSGPTLFTSYFGRDEWTGKSTFVENGARWHKTGDRVKYENGRYYFIGRKDTMVKKRGYRIELGEIEEAIYKSPGVDECVVYSGEGQNGVTITAAVSPATLSTLELRKFLTTELPEYMMPDHINAVESLPRTETGKARRSEIV